jgi:hypothetical protein
MDISETDRKRLEEAQAFSLDGDVGDCDATLCIYADDLDPESVTRLVGCEPTRSRRKGERDPARPKILPARVGQWFLEAPRELAIADKIDFLLNSTTDDLTAWSRLAETHDLQLRIAIYLHSWNEEAYVLNPTLARVAERGWWLSLSIYSAEGNEILDTFLGNALASRDESG